MVDEAPVIVTEKSERPFPGIWASLGWVILFFVLQVVSLVLVTLLDPHHASVAKIAVRGEQLIWSLVGSSVLTLILLWLYLRRGRRVSAIHLDRWSQLSLKTTLLLAVGLVGFALAFNYVYSEYVIPDIEMQDELRRLFNNIPKTGINSILLFGTVAILAPIIEELLFRGLLQTSLSHRLPAIPSVIIAATVFAAIHFDPYAFPALFVMGGVFGYIYYRTGSLRVTILLHMINNGAALLFT
jgi:membrane protease YdiL (CAAX protease family)